MNIKKGKRGFTLLELLIVIAIIGILTSIVLATLDAGKQKSNDTKRVAELKEIQKALNLYFVDNGHYPREGFGEDSGSGVICSGCSGGINTILAQYMTEVPQDPLYFADPTNYYYYYDGNHLCGGQVSQAVVFAAQLETEGWGNLSDADDLCTSWGAEGRISGVDNSYNIAIGNSGNNY